MCVVQTYLILQEQDDCSVQIPQACEDDASFDHEVDSSNEYSKDSPCLQGVGEIADPQRGRYQSPIKLRDIF